MRFAHDLYSTEVVVVMITERLDKPAKFCKHVCVTMWHVRVSLRLCLAVVQYGCVEVDAISHRRTE